jgi:hypothetical protein
MKRILVLYYIIFLTFTFQSCQEAQLPIANYAKIDLSVDWMNYGFMLSANVEKSNDISIIEKGFVIQRNISDDEPYIYKLNPSDEFKANI